MYGELKAFVFKFVFIFVYYGTAVGFSVYPIRCCSATYSNPDIQTRNLLFAGRCANNLDICMHIDIPLNIMAH